MSKPAHICAKTKPAAKIGFYVRIFSNFAVGFILIDNVYKQ